VARGEHPLSSVVTAKPAHGRHIVAAAQIAEDIDGERMLGPISQSVGTDD